MQGHNIKHSQNTRHCNESIPRFKKVSRSQPTRFHLPNSSSVTTNDNFVLQNINNIVKSIQKNVCFIKKACSRTSFACEGREKYTIQKSTLQLFHHSQSDCFVWFVFCAMAVLTCFVMCGCVYVLVLLCVGGLVICVLVFTVFCTVFLHCFAYVYYLFCLY